MMNFIKIVIYIDIIINQQQYMEKKMETKTKKEINDVVSVEEIEKITKDLIKYNRIVFNRLAKV